MGAAVPGGGDGRGEASTGPVVGLPVAGGPADPEELDDLSDDLRDAEVDGRDLDDDLDDARGARREPTLLEQMGGVSGVVASGVPVVVFVAVQAVFSVLLASILAAVGAAAAITIWRLVRGEGVQPAFAGLFGVAVCALIAWRTGEAKGFFLLGIWTSLVYGGVFLASVLVRWPLVGVIWHGVNGDGQGWRQDSVRRRAFDLASLAWVVVFAARFVVQRWLYDSVYAESWLGWVRLAMGLPLAALAALVTIWAIRRSQQVTAAAA